MSCFGSLQAEFARALLDPGRPPPAALASSGDIPPVRRFAVYRNNVIVGLVDALRARFPATERLVGADFFVFLARAFMDAHPPESPVLTFFGDRLPYFLQHFEPASEFPYLADVARIECARTHSYHARDAVPSDLAALLSRSPDAITRAKLILHPAFAVVRSTFPAFSIWSMNARTDVEPHPVDFDRPEDTLIARPELDVVVEPLPQGAATFMEALRRASFGDAANEAARQAPGLDLARMLAQLIRVGAFAGFEPEPAHGGG